MAKTWAVCKAWEESTPAKFSKCLWVGEEGSEAAVLDKEESQLRKTQIPAVGILSVDSEDSAGSKTSILGIWVLSGKNLSRKEDRKSDTVIIFNDFLKWVLNLTKSELEVFIFIRPNYKIKFEN